MIQLPAIMRFGDELSAEQWNLLREVAAMGTSVSATGGIYAALRGQNLALSSRLGRGHFARHFVTGEVVAVHVDPGGGGQGLPSRPSAVTYKIEANILGWFDDLVTPTFGRPVTGDEVAIYPAPVGMPCWAFRRPDGEGSLDNLWCIEEHVANGPCPP